MHLLLLLLVLKILLLCGLLLLLLLLLVMNVRTYPPRRPAPRAAHFGLHVERPLKGSSGSVLHVSRSGGGADVPQERFEAAGKGRGRRHELLLYEVLLVAPLLMRLRMRMRMRMLLWLMYRAWRRNTNAVLLAASAAPAASAATGGHCEVLQYEGAGQLLAVAVRVLDQVVVLAVVQAAAEDAAHETAVAGKGFRDLMAMSGGRARGGGWVGGGRVGGRSREGE